MEIGFPLKFCRPSLQQRVYGACLARGEMADESNVEESSITFNILKQALTKPFQNRVLGRGLGIFTKFQGTHGV